MIIRWRLLICCGLSVIGAAPVQAAAEVAPDRAGPVAAAAEPCRLLLDNDDGISAPGIHALYAALKDICTLVVVAPSTDQSGMSQAVPNVARGLVVRSVAFEPGVAGYAVDGTPAEAACLGILQFSGGRRFDLLISGINAGENTGLGNLYSGTVNAGMEAMVRGVPAIAFSLDDAYGQDYSAATPFIRAVVRQALAHPLPDGVMLNINIPKPYHGIALLPSRGLSVTLDGFTPSDTPPGAITYRPHFSPNRNPPPGGDVAGYQAGLITITPLALNRTADRKQARLKAWVRAIRP